MLLFIFLFVRRLQINVTITCADAGVPPKSASTAFGVIVGDVNDNPPIFSQPVYYANITENSGKNAEVSRKNKVVFIMSLIMSAFRRWFSIYTDFLYTRQCQV
jgi:hypothetical protein